MWDDWDLQFYLLGDEVLNVVQLTTVWLFHIVLWIGMDISVNEKGEWKGLIKENINN